MKSNRLNFRFRPHWLVRNPHVQTIYSSLRNSRGARLEAASQEMILNADGIRLVGYYAPRPNGQSRATVLLLHGWLGHARANYVVALGERLYERGYNIFRLNLRDHGGTHALNPGIFRADRLDEVFAALQQVANLHPDRPLHLVGASLGGNFALRLAWRHSQLPLANLGQTVAICPAIDPDSVTRRLDRSPLYLAYFRRKWRRAFRRKQAAFPGRYDFSHELAASTCMEMTEAFMTYNGPYADAQAYFERYTVTPKMMRALISPVTIIAAADDPIIPSDDIYPLADLSPNLTVTVQPYGGHVGFIDVFPFHYWLNDILPLLLP